MSWPVRVRRLSDAEWHTGRSINLSVTGILLKTSTRYSIGERVEVEIDFLVHPHARTVIRGAGQVVREDQGVVPHGAAIQFDNTIGAPAGAGRQTFVRMGSRRESTADVTAGHEFEPR